MSSIEGFFPFLKSYLIEKRRGLTYLETDFIIGPLSCFPSPLLAYILDVTE